jgi:hypothetical protein
LDQIRAGFQAAIGRRRVQLLGGLAIATSVFLLIIWPRRGGPPEDLQLHTLSPYRFQLQARDGSGRPPPEDLTLGLKAYDAGEFERAKAHLTHARLVELNDVQETVRKIYLGSALAWTKEYGEAAQVLERIDYLSVPGRWRGEAQWTLFVALRVSGREASADSLLQILMKKPGEIGERARSWVQQKQHN